LDFNAAYQHAFVYIRELAVQLRAALQTKAKESYQKVYTWPYVHSLRIWGRLVSEFPQQKELQPLIYPITQIIFGVITLRPTPRYFPLRFHCIRILNQIATATGVFLSVVPHILETLDSPELHKKSKPTSDIKRLNFVHTIKVSKSQLQTKDFQDAVFSNCYDLLLEYFSIYSYSIAFPELIIPATIHLKKWVKTCRNAYYKKQINFLLEKLEQQRKWIIAYRSKVDFSPSEISKAKQFLAEEKEGNKSPLAQIFKEHIKKQEELRAKEQIISGQVAADNDDSIDDSNEIEMEDDKESESIEKQPLKQAPIKLPSKKRLRELENNTRDIIDEGDVMEEMILSDDEEEAEKHHKKHKKEKTS